MRVSGKKKQFLAFVKKEFCHIFRDRRTVLVLLIMPILLIIILGFAITNELRNARVALLDLSNDPVARNIVQCLDASEYFTFTKVFHSQQEMEEAFYAGDVDMTVILEDDFSDNLYIGGASILLAVDATDPNIAVTEINYAQSILGGVLRNELQNIRLPQSILPILKLLYNPQMKSAYNFVPGTMGLIMLLICAMMTSISIVREKETGSMEVLLASPIPPLFIILSKAIPYFTLSMVNLATILLLSVFVLGVPIEGSLLLIVFISLLYIFVSLALGLVISSITATQIAALVLSSLGLMMPTMVLSGMIFPIEGMPWVLRVISDVVPARWYISAMRKLMVEGVPWEQVWQETAILTGMAVVLRTVSLKMFNPRLEK